MIWNKKDLEASEVRDLTLRYDLDAMTASILLRRGLQTGEDLLFFLKDDPVFLHNPFLFRQMEDLVERIQDAAAEEEKVLVFGDRDADGITSTVLMVQALQEMGLKPQWKVPAENDNYGLSCEAVQAFAEEGGTLIITVDCGISNHKEVELAGELGVDVIILDHHTASAQLPAALAIINPKVPGETYPFPHLAACGVVAKVLWALRFGAQESLWKKPFCLVHAREEEGSLVVQALQVENLNPGKRIHLVFTPGSTPEAKDKLVNFLQGHLLMTWDNQKQVPLLKQIFGPRALFEVFDLKQSAAKHFPTLASQTMVELRALSTRARFASTELSDPDILLNLYHKTILQAYPTLGEKYYSRLDLVAMGTLADMMSLEDENRILVKLGLEALAKTQRRGLEALLTRLNLRQRRLSASEVSWNLTPVINAAGRMGKPELALEILLDENPTQRQPLVQGLEALNQQRKTQTKVWWDQILPQARTSLEALKGAFILVSHPEIPRGITGILASRLMNTFQVPSLVMTQMEDRHVGSLRSCRGFPTRKFLEAFEDIFTDFGGHDAAAGFNLLTSKMGIFEHRLPQVVAQCPLESPESQTLEVDAEISTLTDQDLAVLPLKAVDTLEPYGEGHRPLVFLHRNLKVLEIKAVSSKVETGDLRLLLGAGSLKIPAVWWKAHTPGVQPPCQEGETIEAVFHVARNTFGANETLQWTILDIKKAPAGKTGA